MLDYKYRKDSHFLVKKICMVAVRNFHVALGCLPLVTALERSGSFSTQPYVASAVMTFEDFDFYGDGMAYDSLRDYILIGTTSNSGSQVAGRIYGVPYVSPALFAEADSRVVYGGEDSMALIFGGSDLIPSFAGLEMDPADSDIVWAAAGVRSPDASSPCGIAKIDIQTGSLLQYYDLTGHRSVYNSNGACLPNDIVFDDAGNLYATDFYGYQVWKIALSTDSAVSVVSDDIALLCNEYSGPCPPNEQSSTISNGPNGIEFVDGNLIVAVSSNRMVKLDLVNVSDSAVIAQFPQDGIQGCDGNYIMCSHQIIDIILSFFLVRYYFRLREGPLVHCWAWSCGLGAGRDLQRRLVLDDRTRCVFSLMRQRRNDRHCYRIKFGCFGVLLQ